MQSGDATGAPLRVSGGGSQRDAALQLTADVFGFPTARPHTYETSGLGAAIDAAIGLGLQPSYESAVRGMTRVETVREPDRSTHEVFEGRYQRVYRHVLAACGRWMRRSAGSPAMRRPDRSGERSLRRAD